MDSGSGRFVFARLTSGSRFVACCLIAVTLVLLAIPDEADLQPVMIGGLQAFIDDVDDADDGDTGVGYTAVAAVDRGAVHSNGMFAQGDVGEDTMFDRRIRSAESVSSRGPPKDGLDDTKHNLAPKSPSRREMPYPSSQVTPRSPLRVPSNDERPQRLPEKHVLAAGNRFDLSQKIAPARDAAATCDSDTLGDFGTRGRNLI